MTWNPATWDTELIVGAVVMVVCCTLTHIVASWGEAKVAELFARADVRRGER